VTSSIRKYIVLINTCGISLLRQQKLLEKRLAKAEDDTCALQQP